MTAVPGITQNRNMISATIVAMLLASFPDIVSAQGDCAAIPTGPARTDCYIGLGRIYQGQSDIAAAKARKQTGAARHRQVTGTARLDRRKGPETGVAQKMNLLA
jgi:hypothetical protein